MNFNPNAVKDAIESFPATFQLRASAIPFGHTGDLFRISPSASYVNDDGDVQLVLERHTCGKWQEFGKAYIAELSDFIIRPSAITAESLKTPMREFEDATAEVANLAEIVVNDFDNPDEIEESLQELRNAIKVRRDKQDAMLRAIRGR